MIRSVIAVLTAACSTSVSVSASAAESYPSRPIEVIVPLTAGSVIAWAS